MPGIIDRHTGEIIQMPSLSKEAKEAMVQAMLRHYLQENPQVIQEALEAAEANPDFHAGRQVRHGADQSRPGQ